MKLQGDLSVGAMTFTRTSIRLLAIVVSWILLQLNPVHGQDMQSRPEFPFDRSRSAVSGNLVKQWVLVLKQNANLSAITQRLGVRVVRNLNNVGTVVLVEFPDTPKNFTELEKLASLSPEILSIEPQIPVRLQSRTIPKDPLLKSQWHLVNSATTGTDINIAPVWKMKFGSPPVPINGTGVTVGIVDSGFDYVHPDLASAFLLSASYDAFGNALNLPSTKPNQAQCSKVQFCHATLIAGVTAETQNGIGGVGVAPGAKLGDLRLTYMAATDVQESNTEQYMANAIAIKNNSWGPCDYLGHYLAGGIYDYTHFVCSAPQTDRLLPVRPGSALQSGLYSITNTSAGRGGLGIFVSWAAGNGADLNGLDRAHERTNPDDPTYQYAGAWGGYDGYTCNRYVAAVGATNVQGQVAAYGTPAPCILVVAPGGDSAAGIVSTDLRGRGNGFNPTSAQSGGNYTRKTPSDEYGTSFASPMVAGVAALMLQVNPTLSYRDIFHILVNTAKRIDATNPSWYQNGSLRWVSRDYGFGLLNTAAAVQQAESWTTVGPLVSYVPTQSCYNVQIPHNLVGTTFGFNISSRIKVEHVEVLVGVTHPSPGNLQVKVQSPTGTKAVVVGVPQLNRREANLFYLFTTTHFWDELTPGRWAVTVTDPMGGPFGTFNCAAVNIYGTAY